MSHDTSIKIYEGRTQYNEWKFVFREQEGAAQGGQGSTGGQDPGTPWGQVTPFPTPPQPQRTGTPQY